MVERDRELNRRLKVFISYSREDARLKEKLQTHLTVLEDLEMIEPWHDGMISPGDDWEEKIRANLEIADIVLLLVSAYFLKSKYCRKEMEIALARHHSDKTPVIPVILSHCMWWKVTDLKRLNCLPTAGKPIMKWRNHDEALENVCNGIETVIEGVRDHDSSRLTKAAARNTSAPTKPKVPPPRDNRPPAVLSPGNHVGGQGESDSIVEPNQAAGGKGEALRSGALRVAVVQMDYNLAYGNALQVPIDTPLSFVRESGFWPAEKIRVLPRGQDHTIAIQRDYEEAFRQKLRITLEFCIQKQVNLVLFPEYSIPPNCLDVVEEPLAGSESDMVIIAGTHVQEKPNQYRELKSDRSEKFPFTRNELPIAICPVFEREYDRRTVLHLMPKRCHTTDETLSIGMSSENRDTKNLDMITLFRDKWAMCLLACRDAIDTAASIQDRSFQILAIVADAPLDDGMKAHYDSLQFNKPYFSLFANHSNFGGTAIQFSKASEKGRSKVTEGEEGIIIADLELERAPVGNDQDIGVPLCRIVGEFPFLYHNRMRRGWWDDFFDLYTKLSELYENGDFEICESLLQDNLTNLKWWSERSNSLLFEKKIKKFINNFNGTGYPDIDKLECINFDSQKSLSTQTWRYLQTEKTISFVENFLPTLKDGKEKEDIGDCLALFRKKLVNFPEDQSPIPVPLDRDDVSFGARYMSDPQNVDDPVLFKDCEFNLKNWRRRESKSAYQRVFKENFRRAQDHDLPIRRWWLLRLFSSQISSDDRCFLLDVSSYVKEKYDRKSVAVGDMENCFITFFNLGCFFEPKERDHEHTEWFYDKAHNISKDMRLAPRYWFFANSLLRLTTIKARLWKLDKAIELLKNGIRFYIEKINGDFYNNEHADIGNTIFHFVKGLKVNSDHERYSYAFRLGYHLAVFYRRRAEESYDEQTLLSAFLEEGEKLLDWLERALLEIGDQHDMRPQLARCYHAKGNIFRLRFSKTDDSKSAENAKSCYKAAIDLDPSFGMAYFDLAKILDSSKKQVSRRIEYFRKAYDIFYESGERISWRYERANFYQCMGWSSLEIGNEREAEIFLDEAIALSKTRIPEIGNENIFSEHADRYVSYSDFEGHCKELKEQAKLKKLSKSANF